MNIQQIDIGLIKPYAKNPRKNKAAVDTVKLSLKEFGFKQPIVVDKDMTIVVGHTRFLAAQQLEYKQVPIVVADELNEEQIKAYRIMDNRSNENADWDNELLKQELKDLEANYDLALTGFTAEDLNELFRDTEDGQTDPDDVPEIATEYRAKKGDLWILGNHRLVCGDSLSDETYQLLLGNEQADMCWTDPPYNIAYQSAKFRTKNSKWADKDNHKQNDVIANDKMSNEEFAEFIYKAIKQTYNNVKDGAAIYISHSESEIHNFHQATKLAGYKFKQNLVWIKNSIILGGSDYQKRYEPIIYAIKPGAIRYFISDRGTDSVIDQRVDYSKWTKDELIKALTSYPTDSINCNKTQKADLHPTMKPVKLITEMMLNSSIKNDIVLDPFGGSGSTLIAAEQTQRKARLIELQPKYVDVIIKRWQDFTGEQAIRSDGTPWDNIDYYAVDDEHLADFFNMETTNGS